MILNIKIYVLKVFVSYLGFEASGRKKRWVCNKIQISLFMKNAENIARLKTKPMGLPYIFWNWLRSQNLTAIWASTSRIFAILLSCGKQSFIVRPVLLSYKFLRDFTIFFKNTILLNKNELSLFQKDWKIVYV